MPNERYISAENPPKSDQVPVSTSTRVHLSLNAAAVDVSFPELMRRIKTVLRLISEWIECRMKSESLPGYYFICSENGLADQD